LNSKKIKAALLQSLLPGRMQLFTINKQTVVLDGAHNPQKMLVFIKSLTQYFPKQKFDFLVGFKKGKDYRDMLRYVIPYAETITITSFSSDKTTKEQGFKVLSEDPNVIVKVLNRLYYPDYNIIVNNSKAFKSLISGKNKVKVV